MKYVVFLAASIFVSTTALADDIASCAPIDTDLDRLACYDKVSGRTAIATPVPTTSKWDVEINKSEFEDTTDVYLRLTSEQPVSCAMFGDNAPATLLVRCMENTTSIFISTNCHVASGHGGYGRVDIRLDDEKAFKQDMDESTSNKALGLWRGGQSIPLIKRMLGKDRMIVRFTPYSQGPVTAEFSIAGMDEAIKPLRESCRW